MYKDFFHFKEEPFNITADPDFFFSSVHHAEAVAHLEYGINQRKGIIVVTGEIGTGKTTLCRTLLNRLDRKTKTALILNPDFSNLQLLQMILKDLGIEYAGKNRFALISALNEFLIEEAGKGNNVVIILDEAQNLSVRQLEQVRLLSNLETEKHKLLQIVLVGQPELLKKLKLNSLRQLNQRISVRYHIMPLEKTETKNYINHRLKIAQNGKHETAQLEFEIDAIETIFELSKGTPRMINILCDRTLLAGFNAETHMLTKDLVLQAASEIV